MYGICVTMLFFFGGGGWQLTPKTVKVGAKFETEVDGIAQKFVISGL